LSGVDGALVTAFLAVIIARTLLADLHDPSYVRPVGDKRAGAKSPGLWPLY
jgi:hypothetical protein